VRLLLTLAALVTLAATPPIKDWRLTAATTPAGAFTHGNPAAGVKLVEYLSFTCPHCGHFVEQSKPVLVDQMVRGGSVQVETRAAVRDPYDLAAWSVARCGGPTRFAGLSRAIFAEQAAWMKKGEAYASANLAKVRSLPQRQQIRVIADQSGLSAIGARAGVTPAALTKCLATDAQVAQLLKMTEAAFARIPGTPGFEVNGALVDGYDWATLEPKLRVAGAR
jgi:protein-disulfide isomerase